MSADEFLTREGINLFQTALFTIIDGYVRQPDLCWLMECYAKEKVAEALMKKEKDSNSESKSVS